MENWISVKERLPEKDSYIIAQTIGGIDDGLCTVGVFKTAVATGGSTAFWCEGFEKGDGLWFFTHWMPLPFPPKEGERCAPKDPESKLEAILEDIIEETIQELLAGE